MTKTAIIGAGVLGSAIAWRLAQTGAEVDIYDPEPGIGASGGSLAWLNAAFAEDPVYNRLRHDSLQIWARLKAEEPDLPIVFSGAILWQQDHFDLDAVHAAQLDLGRPSRLLDRAEHAAAEPAVPDPPDQSLALDGDGYGDPHAINAWFLARARDLGARYHASDVAGIETTDGRVTGLSTDAGHAPADRVVIAAGVKLPDLLAPLGLTLAMDNRPGLLVTTSAAPPQISAMLATDKLHGWQGSDGRFLVGADFGGGADFGDPDGFAAALVQDLGRLIPGAQGRTVEKVTIRERPMPADGRPAIGPLGPDGLYVVTTHSGMTLAPVVGEIVAKELATQMPDPRMDPYRPDRAALQ